jgi:hypothetical protein
LWHEAGTACWAPASYGGGDGGNRTRVRETRARTSTSLAGPSCVARGVAASRATPEPSRWEPKLPLRRSYRLGSAALRQLCACPCPAEGGQGDVTLTGQCCPFDLLGSQRSGGHCGHGDRYPSVVGTYRFSSVVNGAGDPRPAVRTQPSPSKPGIPIYSHYNTAFDVGQDVLCQDQCLLCRLFRCKRC